MDSKDETIIHLLKAGLSQSEISEETGFSQSIIEKRIKGLKKTFGAKTIFHLATLIMETEKDSKPDKNYELINIFKFYKASTTEALNKRATFKESILEICAELNEEFICWKAGRGNTGIVVITTAGYYEFILRNRSLQMIVDAKTYNL